MRKEPMSPRDIKDEARNRAGEILRPLVGPNTRWEERRGTSCHIVSPPIICDDPLLQALRTPVPLRVRGMDQDTVHAYAARSFSLALEYICGERGKDLNMATELGDSGRKALPRYTHQGEKAVVAAWYIAHRYSLDYELDNSQLIVHAGGDMDFGVKGGVTVSPVRGSRELEVSRGPLDVLEQPGRRVDIRNTVFLAFIRTLQNRMSEARYPQDKQQEMFRLATVLLQESTPSQFRMTLEGRVITKDRYDQLLEVIFEDQNPREKLRVALSPAFLSARDFNRKFPTTTVASQHRVGSALRNSYAVTLSRLPFVQPILESEQ